ncbi:MAG: hypothetical protein WCA44_18085 [Acidobacteriaceae bacterium]
MYSIPDNAYGLLLIAMGCVLAFTGAHMGSKDLLSFGSVVAGYGAAVFQNQGKSNQG